MLGHRWIGPLAALLSGTACAAPTGSASFAQVFDPCAVRVSVAADASPAEVAGVDAALAEWNEAAGLGLVRADAADPASLPIRFQPSIPAFFGVYDDEEGSITINRSISDGSVRRIVIMHELGHAFGLPHISPSIEGSLMNPGNDSTPLTDADVARLHALWPRCEGPDNPD